MDTPNLVGSINSTILLKTRDFFPLKRVFGSFEEAWMLRALRVWRAAPPFEEDSK